ncbi:MAG: YwbE family protein [Ruthenibacterium sp.]
MDGKIRANLKPGMTVDIVLKADQRTAKRTRGVIQRLLTNSATHPHGIKVMLTSGEVGRVQAIVAPKENV